MQKKQAFALVELLTVVAVMLVLTSLLLPVLSKAKEQAWRASCTSNQRQLALTWLLYADDHDDQLAQNGYTFGGGEPRRRMWVQGYYNHAVYPSDSTNVSLLTDARFSQFAPYLPSAKVYHCPANRHTVQLRGSKSQPGCRVEKIRSYSMNWFLGWIDEPGTRNPPPGYRQFHKLSELQSTIPGQVIVFTDVNPESICWPFFGIEAKASFFMLPGSYHNRRGIMAWSDGHVETKRWTDDRTTGAIIDDKVESASGAAYWHMHEHASPGNADLRWIKAQVSVVR
ncbi:MAG: type II secretion system protein [Verrucomicrobia bacterium]|nr:type II secretion system protein [Verrucomicrobiota bacterium]